MIGGLNIQGDEVSALLVLAMACPMSPKRNAGRAPVPTRCSRCSHRQLHLAVLLPCGGLASYYKHTALLYMHARLNAISWRSGCHLPQHDSAANTETVSISAAFCQPLRCRLTVSRWYFRGDLQDRRPRDALLVHTLQPSNSRSRAEKHLKSCAFMSVCVACAGTSHVPFPWRLPGSPDTVRLWQPL